MESTRFQRVSADTLPFGPFHLPMDEYDNQYTGTFIGFSGPEEVVTTLRLARAQGLRIFINLAGDRTNFQNEDGSFSLALFQQQLDKFAAVDFGSHVASNVVLGHMMFDEPQDPDNWNGEPVPYEAIEAAAAYSKQLWPDMPVGLGSPPSFLQHGSPWQSLDYSFAQYTVELGDITTWMNDEVSTSQNIGLGIVLGMNVLGGGSTTGRPFTAEELKAYGTTLANSPNACALLFWKWDLNYFSDPDIQSAINAIAIAAASHNAPGCADESSDSSPQHLRFLPIVAAP